MNWKVVTFDWNQVRAFLATVEEGSLSAAARALGQTQPTLSRQVSALEASLGVTLFERGTRVTTLTEPGSALLEHVRTMGEAATRVSLAASAQSQEIEGHVRITATNWIATYQLPRILERLRSEAPLISVEIIASNEIRDLTRREADIAIRHARPTQPDLVAKRLGEMTAQLYASAGFLERFGTPTTVEQCSVLDFIGFEQLDTIIPILNALGLSLNERNFKIRTTSSTTIVELVRRGLGISMLLKDMETRFPDLRRVLPDRLDPILVPIWLVTHRELRTSQRIRFVFDLLAEEIGHD